MPLPERFRTATFESYEPRTPSQATALRAARRVVQAQRRTPSWLDWGRELVGLAPDSHPAGLYLVGPAGTGKTHLLAAMYNALTPAVSCAFLHSSTLFRQTDPPAAVGHRLADEHAVCCLDEVEIDDPANEMRLVGTMKTLAARGVLLLATSNIEPEQALAQQVGSGRIHRFLRREFREQYRIVEVLGADYRRTQKSAQSGRGWIGPSDLTRAAMKEVERAASGATRWWTFDAFRRATTEMPYGVLLDELTAQDHLFLEGVAVATPDDALRLLRVVDALYLHEAAPTLYFTARESPDAWFVPDRQAGVARAVAEKFERTVSRLHALCDVTVAGRASDSGNGQRP